MKAIQQCALFSSPLQVSILRDSAGRWTLLASNGTNATDNHPPLLRIPARSAVLRHPAKKCPAGPLVPLPGQHSV